MTIIFNYTALKTFPEMRLKVDIIVPGSLIKETFYYSHINVKKMSHRKFPHSKMGVRL